MRLNDNRGWPLNPATKKTKQTKKRALGLLWIKFHKPAVRAGPKWTLSPTMTLFYQSNCVLHTGPLMLERRSYNDERWKSWRRFKGDQLMDCKTRVQNNTQHQRSEVAGIICTACTWEDCDSYAEREPSRAASCSAMLMGLSFCPTCL